MQDPDRKLCELAVFNELAQMRQGLLFAVSDELDHVKDGFHDGLFEVVATLIAENTGEEGQHCNVLEGELETERADDVDYDDFELIADFSHKAGDLLHETIYRGFVASLEKR